MTELEQRLEAAAGTYPFPPAPSLRESVVRDLSGRRGLPWRKVGLAVALVVLGAALAAVFSPGARSAFRDWFDFVPGVHVERVEKLPPSARIRAFDLGRRVSLDEARREARFELRLPTGVAVGDFRLAVDPADEAPSVLLQQPADAPHLAQVQPDAQDHGATPGLWNTSNSARPSSLIRR